MITGHILANYWYVVFVIRLILTLINPTMYLGCCVFNIYGELGFSMHCRHRRLHFIFVFTQDTLPNHCLSVTPVSNYKPEQGLSKNGSLARPHLWPKISPPPPRKELWSPLSVNTHTHTNAKLRFSQLLWKHHTLLRGPFFPSLVHVTYSEVLKVFTFSIFLTSLETTSAIN